MVGMVLYESIDDRRNYEPASTQSAIAFLPILNSFRSFLNAYLASRYVTAAPVRAAAATKVFISISSAFVVYSWNLARLSRCLSRLVCL